MASLNGQVALITGGLGDIGRAIALELARRGADIALGDLADQAGPPAYLEALRATGRRVHYQRADVSDRAAVDAWYDAAEASLGLPSLIVANAAVVTPKGILELTAAEWRREMEINLDGAFHTAQEGAIRLRRAERPGRIVFIGSWVANAPRPLIPAYCVSKAGLRMLCRCLAIELAPHDILVNEVAPGNVDAGLSAQLFAEDPALREYSARMVPIGRMMQPDEVAVQVAHLCDPDNQHMTGGVLLMDGGLSLVGP